MRRKLTWKIFDPRSGSYYVGWSGIGPRFGAPRAGAMGFTSAESAILEMGSHSTAFVGCLLELPNGKLRSEVPERAKGAPDAG